ncbi:Ig-like domain-containing protein [Candidatus Microgenomates bacterium]|nr:Ig-like domain-containing protein [Candidatus Microgenomates bacterium]
MKDKTFVTLAVLFFLLFLTGIAALTLNTPLSGILRARNVTPSPLKSFGVVFPQVGNAGIENSPKKPTSIRVSVYIRDVNGSVIPGRVVKLAASSSDVTIKPSDTQTTDKIGQAQFTVTSPVKGIVKFTATDTESNTVISNIPTAQIIE